MDSLSAVESTLINNSMMVQIAVLAWIFLGERPGPLDLVGLLLATAGLVLANLRPHRA